MEEKLYPYLGINTIDDKSYVVLFTEPDYGIVVMDETGNEKCKFGNIGNYAEEVFSPLPPEQCVRLSN